MSNRTYQCGRQAVLWMVIVLLVIHAGCKKDTPSATTKTLETKAATPTTPITTVGEIQRKIAAAKHGDTIHLSPGIYKESLEIDKDINLVGESAETVVLQPESSSGRNGIKIYNGARVTLKEITIQCKPESTGQPLVNGVSITKGFLLLSHCRMTGAKSNGLYAVDSEVNVDNCIFDLNENCGIQASFSRITVQNCRIFDNVGAGVFCQTEARLDNLSRERCVYELTDNQIMKNDKGVSVSGHSTGTISRCQIQANKSVGVSMVKCEGKNDIIENVISQSAIGISYYVLKSQTGEKGLIKGNVCTQTDTGIWIRHESDAEVIQNKCTNNNQHGIGVAETACAEIRDNICNNNSEQGIYIGSEQDNIRVLGNECCDNKLNGIYITAGIVQAEKNKCLRNVYNGVSIIASEAHLGDNECSENKGSGIYFDRYTDGSACRNICRNNRFYGIVRSTYTSIPDIGEDNQLADNVKGPTCQETRDYGDVRLMLKHEQFDELDAIAGKLRKEETRTADGRWQIRFFYEDLSDCWYLVSSKHRAWAVDTINRWIQKKPGSITPYVVLAEVYISNAWGERGVGWAYQVEDKEWKNFRENLDKAVEVIRKAESLTEKDAHLYSSLIKVGMGLSDRGLEDEGFEKGILINKYYPQLYFSKAIALLPRWGGRKGEYEAFAGKAVELTSDREGHILYARLALTAHSYMYPDFDGFKFSYEKIKQGHEDILKRYPTSTYYMNSYCLFACLNNDIAKAREWFEKLNGDFSEEVWKNRDYLNQHRSWAMSDGPRK